MDEIRELMDEIQELMGEIQELMDEIQELMDGFQDLMENRYFLNCSAIENTKTHISATVNIVFIL